MTLCDAQWKWWAGFCAISLVVGSLKPAQACYRITYGRPCRWPNRECRQFAARHRRRRALAADCSANRSISQSVNTIHFRRCFSMHPRRAVLRPQTAHEGLLTTLATRNCLRCCRHTDTTHTHTHDVHTIYRKHTRSEWRYAHACWMVLRRYNRRNIFARLHPDIYALCCAGRKVFPEPKSLWKWRARVSFCVYLIWPRGNGAHTLL